MRRASEAWFARAMKSTAFFYVGLRPDEASLTGKAENVYGLRAGATNWPRDSFRHRRTEHGDDAAPWPGYAAGGFRR